MKKFMFLSVFLFLFLISGVIAPASITNVNSNTGYQIKVPLYDSVKVNHYFDFNFHVFNISDGLPISNSSTQCNFHLYNESGDHIYTDTRVSHDPTSDHGVVNEWVERLDGGNFTYVGTYNYILQCNGSTYGGFYDSQIIVTPTGYLMSTQQSVIMVVIISVLLLIIILFFIFGMNNEYMPVKLFCLSMSVILIIFTIGYILQLTNISLAEFISLTNGINPIYILFISLLTVGGVGIVVYLIAISFQQFHKTKYGIGE